MILARSPRAPACVPSFLVDRAVALDPSQELLPIQPRQAIKNRMVFLGRTMQGPCFTEMIATESILFELVAWCQLS